MVFVLSMINSFSGLYSVGNLRPGYGSNQHGFVILDTKLCTSLSHCFGGDSEAKCLKKIQMALFVAFTVCAVLSV